MWSVALAFHSIYRRVSQREKVAYTQEKSRVISMLYFKYTYDIRMMGILYTQVGISKNGTNIGGYMMVYVYQIYKKVYTVYIDIPSTVYKCYTNSIRQYTVYINIHFSVYLLYIALFTVIFFGITTYMQDTVYVGIQSFCIIIVYRVIYKDIFVV